LVDTVEIVNPQLSKADIAEGIIRRAGKPVHAKAIAETLTKDYGKPSTNRTVAASMYQDPKKRFKNLGENTWDLVSRSEGEAA
jgi:DNA-directed RNA polymerase delta subunit